MTLDTLTPALPDPESRGDGNSSDRYRTETDYEGRKARALSAAIRGAVFLDTVAMRRQPFEPEVVPLNWRQLINRDHLYMASVQLCVLGQLGLRMTKLGFGDRITFHDVVALTAAAEGFGGSVAMDPGQVLALRGFIVHPTCGFQYRDLDEAWRHVLSSSRDVEAVTDPYAALARELEDVGVGSDK